MKFSFSSLLWSGKLSRKVELFILAAIAKSFVSDVTIL